MSERGVNPTELGKATGVSNKTISGWKQGLSKPSADAVVKIAKYFGVSTDYLLTGVGVSPSLEPDGKVLTIPSELEGIKFAFHRGEFEDLTQEEVDALAIIATTLKAQRKL